MQNNKFTKKREADNRQLLFVSIFMFIHVVIKQVELKIEIESRLYCIDIYDNDCKKNIIFNINKIKILITVKNAMV